MLSSFHLKFAYRQSLRIGRIPALTSLYLKPMNKLTIVHRIVLLVGYNGLSVGNSAESAHELDRQASDMRQIVGAYRL